jgi:hypothetical protein
MPNLCPEECQIYVLKAVRELTLKSDLLPIVADSSGILLFQAAEQIVYN